MIQCFRYGVAVLVLGIACGFSNRVCGEAPDMLQQALDLVHKAESHPATAELLLENKADVNAAGNPDSLWAGQTALFISACNGAADVARVPIAHGADTNAKGKDGLTPLEIAVKNHHDAPPGSINDVAGVLRAAGAE